MNLYFIVKWVTSTMVIR